jgi:hypothetical protein
MRAGRSCRDLDGPVESGVHARAQGQQGETAGVGAPHEDADAAHLLVHCRRGGAGVLWRQQGKAWSAEHGRRRWQAGAVLCPVVRCLVVVDQQLHRQLAVGQIVDRRQPTAHRAGHCAVPACIERIVVRHQPARRRLAQQLYRGRGVVALRPAEPGGVGKPGLFGRVVRAWRGRGGSATGFEASLTTSAQLQH